MFLSSVIKYINVKLGRRCNGDCCKYFFLPFSPEELKEEEYLARKEIYFAQIAGHWVKLCKYDPKELIQVAEMVRFIESKPSSTNPKITNHYYYCTKQLSNGNCGIYATRPRLCSDYPSYNIDNKCKYPNCTWKRQKDLIPDSNLITKMVNHNCKGHV